MQPCIFFKIFIKSPRRDHRRGLQVLQIQEAFLHNIAVSYGDFQIFHFFLREEPGFLGFIADANGRFFIQFQFV